MKSNMRCLICDVAFSMGKSEQQFYSEFPNRHEREQLLATYQSQQDRAFVRSAYPPKGN